jgi:hypothetical protein
MACNGGFRWTSKRAPLSHLLEGRYIGPEEVGDGIWNGYYSHVRRGQMDERILEVEDALGRRMRNPQVQRMSPAVHMLRSRWRGLETELPLGPHGYERGDPGYGQDLELTDHRASPRPYRGGEVSYGNPDT